MCFALGFASLPHLRRGSARKAKRWSILSGLDFVDFGGVHVAFYRVSELLAVETMPGDFPLGFAIGFASLPRLWHGSG